MHIYEIVLFVFVVLALILSPAEGQTVCKPYYIDELCNQAREECGKKSTPVGRACVFAQHYCDNETAYKQLLELQSPMGWRCTGPETPEAVDEYL